jgi:hypothetical protein
MSPMEVKTFRCPPALARRFEKVLNDLSYHLTLAMKKPVRLVEGECIRYLMAQAVNMDLGDLQKFLAKGGRLEDRIVAEGEALKARLEKARADGLIPEGCRLPEETLGILLAELDAGRLALEEVKEQIAASEDTEVHFGDGSTFKPFERRK